MPTIFAYGSLRQPIPRRQALGRDVAVRSVLATHVARVPAPANSKHVSNLTEGPAGSTAEGIVFEITGAELARLDAWEEPYTRRSIKCTDGTEAQTYVSK